MNRVDVLCVGYACWDLNFLIPNHPGPDEKLFAQSLTSEGGGPASNAAYTIAQLGGRAAFMGQLGNDTFGRAHLEELREAGVDISCILISDTQTSTSSIWVNQQGQRAIVNYRPDRSDYAPAIEDLQAQCLLMDGHELEASKALLQHFPDLPSILDAGSLNDSTRELSSMVTHLVASSTFATDLTGSTDSNDWLQRLSESASFAAVTHGDQGIYWQSSIGSGGHIKASAVEAIDTTAAGDIFHGAFALALSKGKAFPSALEWANQVAGISVTRVGGRRSVPQVTEVPSLNDFE